MKKIFFLLWIWASLCSPSQSTEIILWHAMAGQLGEELNQMVDAFNQSQQEYVIHSLYKGSYIDVLTSFSAAFRAGQPPALVQIFEVGTQAMLKPEGVIKPLEDIMKAAHQELPKSSMFPGIRKYYSYADHMMALPLNVSLPILYFNKDALKKFGVTEENFPRTWHEFEILAKDLTQAGYECAYTTAYPAWILIESFASVHGINLTDFNQSTSSSFSHHLGRLLQWQKQHYFVYGGRNDDATVLFTSGRCPLFSHSSGVFKSLVSLVSFQIGVAKLPLDESISMTRHSNVIGGGALWAAEGQTREVYLGIAKFYTYLLSPEVQKRWYQRTGYLPLGLKGVYLSIDKDESSHSILRLAADELIDNDNPLSFAAQNQIRTIYDQVLEAVFAKIKTPEEAMNEGESRIKSSMTRFEKNTS